MGITVKMKQGTTTTSVQHSHKGKVVTEQEKTLPFGEPKSFAGNPAVVGVEASLTLNLGNYNSTRVGCSIQLPCLHGEIDDVFLFAKQWVDDRMSLMAEETSTASVD